MNRERLKTLRDHLAGLPDERVKMTHLVRWEDGPESWWLRPMGEIVHDCGTSCCIAGWANAIFSPEVAEVRLDSDDAANALSLSADQKEALFFPTDYFLSTRYSRADAIAAIDSMLANPDELALPVWPEKAVSA